MIRPILFIVMVAAAAQAGLAHAHFFGGTKSIDKYQVVFAPSPPNPLAADNSTRLNFSILENNTNIYNIYAALLISDQSGRTIGQVPYKQFEFSDITIPYTFPANGRYVVILQTRITDDEKYQTTPLEAAFDISVGQIPFDELMLFYVTPAAAVIAGIAIYLMSKNKL